GTAAGRWTQDGQGRLAGTAMEKAPRDPRAVFDKWQSPVQETLRQRTRMTARGAWTAAVEMRMMAPRSALVAQLDRVLPSEGRGRGFESRRVRHLPFRPFRPADSGYGIILLPNRF